MTDKLDPAEVLRDLERMASNTTDKLETVLRNAATLILQMQAAMVEADRRGHTDRGDEHINALTRRIVEPLAPYLPKPVDPLVGALNAALWDVSNVKLTAHELTCICNTIRRGGTITWKDGV